MPGHRRTDSRASESIHAVRLARWRALKSGDLSPSLEGGPAAGAGAHCKVRVRRLPLDCRSGDGQITDTRPAYGDTPFGVIEKSSQPVVCFPKDGGQERGATLTQVARGTRCRAFARRISILIGQHHGDHGVAVIAGADEQLQADRRRLDRMPVARYALKPEC